MFDDDFQDGEWDSMDELLQKYDDVKNGVAIGMMQEDEFERVIEYYFQNSNEEQALLACDIARTYYPFSSVVLLLKAEILTQAQKYGQAMKVLDEMEQYDQNNLDAVLLRSDIMLGQFKYDQAAALLEIKTNEFEGKDKIELLLELSDVYDECEEFDAVFDTLKRVIKVDKRNEEALQKICFWANLQTGWMKALHCILRLPKKTLIVHWHGSISVLPTKVLTYTKKQLMLMNIALPLMKSLNLPIAIWLMPTCASNGLKKH